MKKSIKYALIILVVSVVAFFLVAVWANNRLEKSYFEQFEQKEQIAPVLPIETSCPPSKDCNADPKYK